jgi:hypothetical protein
VLSKCAAGRPRDWDYARDALAAGVVDGLLPLPEAGRQHVESVLRSIIAKAR